MLRPVIKKTANHDAWQNSNTAGFQSKPKPAAISGGRSVRSGKGERWATMIGEVVQCYSRERYENPQPILPGMLIERGCPKSRHRPGSSADVLIFQRGPISFDEDLIVNRRRGDAQSRFSPGFGRPLVETEYWVRSQTAKKIHHKIHKIT